MKILAIDSSSSNASVAILEDQSVLIELNNEEEKTHSQKLMPMIDEAFKKTNLTLNDIKLISCGLGPGSFTGVRIGIATSKAFSDSMQISCTGISSLEALAYNLNTEGYICSLIDAKHGNIYVGLFHLIKDEKNGLLQTINSDLNFLNLKDKNGEIVPNELIKFIQNNDQITINSSPIYFVGDGTIVYKYLLQNLLFEKNNEIILAKSNQNVISSISIAKSGYTKYKNGIYGDSSILSPIYLRKSQAELALEENKQS